MEVFFINLPIMVAIIALTALYRLNNRFAESHHFLHLSNMAGKWLTLTGGLALFPLLMILIFAPDISSSSVPWAFPAGVLGSLALLIAAVVLFTTFIGECMTHQISVKRITLHFYRHTFKKWIVRYGLKALAGIAGVFLVVVFMPFIADVLTAIAYVLFFIVAGRLGMLDKIEEEGFLTGGDFYNYATGKWDHGYSAGGMYHHNDA